MSDGMLRTDEEVMQKMRSFLGFRYIGKRIRKAFEQTLRDVRVQEKSLWNY